MSLRKLSFLILISFIAGGLVFAASLPVSAQDQGQEGQQEMQKKMQKMQEIGERLQSVQEETLKDNPKLEERQKDLDAMVQKKMDENMEKKGINMEELESLQSKLQSQDLEEGQEKELKAKWQEKVSAYQEARMETMNNEDVQEQQEKFRDDMIQAMEEKEPETKSMLDELEKLQQEMQAMQQSMQQGMGQGQQ